MKAKFVLSKRKVLEQYNRLRELGLKVSYSFKTNREVGKILLEETDSEFSIHLFEEIDMLNAERVWFFLQAEDERQIEKILDKKVRNFVVDNEIDLDRLLKVAGKRGEKINLLVRMKFFEHRVGTGKYFVYGMPSKKVNELILKIKDNKNIGKLGIHIHRKSQNVTEWEIKRELEDSLDKEVLERINIVNLGGGLPVLYKSYPVNVFPYISKKIKDVIEWLKVEGVEVYIEPGRFIAAPSVKLETEIIQVYDKNIVINTSVYQCALDSVITHTKMFVEGELGEDEEGENYLIKGNSPTRDDIFRYKVKLDKEKVKVGKKIVFLNAGAYNYSTDFCGFEKLETEVVEDF